MSNQQTLTEEQKEIRRQREELANSYPELMIGGDLVFIPLRVNGVLINAMIDCGAQECVCSVSLCRKCHLEKQIDKTFSRTFAGMGQSKSIGTVHLVQMHFGNTVRMCSVHVLDENSPTDFLLIGTNTLRSMRVCYFFVL